MVLISSEKTTANKALYQIIIDDIMKKIERREFTFDVPFCTERELMEQYQVSRITVTRALKELEDKGMLYRKRGVGSFVSRTIDTAQIQQTNSNMFAFVLPFDITKGGLKEVFHTANMILNEKGYYITLYITDFTSPFRGREVLKNLYREGVAGVIYYPKTSDIHLDILNRYIYQDRPIVVMDVNCDCNYINNVVSDNIAGGYDLTEYLISLGHRKIAYFSGIHPSKRSSVCDRFGGYLEACRAHGLERKEEYLVVIPPKNHYEMKKNSKLTMLQDAILKLYKKGVTAIEAENDELAFSIIVACKDLGIDVPEELSICGFDQSEWCDMVPNGITTIAQDFSKIGEHIAAILLDQVENRTIQTKKIVVPIKLIKQGSTTIPKIK